jgi:signal transduction histidine kinase
MAWGYLAIPSLAYPYAFAENVAISGVGVLAVWAAGAYAGKRRRVIIRLETAQDAATHAVQQERARVAYDLHDVIGHAITVMVLQAAGARRILDRDPARATEALTAVEVAGAEATRELDQLVGVLTAASATDAGSGGESPMRLADMDGLIERARAAVREIRVSVDGRPRRLEPSVDLAGYCVVREALSNAVKHVGPDAQVDIAVSWSDGRVCIDVTSSGAGSAPSHSTELSVGYGLVGVRERVRVAGGELTWSAGDDGFTVKADLPTAPAR